MNNLFGMVTTMSKHCCPHIVSDSIFAAAYEYYVSKLLNLGGFLKPYLHEHLIIDSSGGLNQYCQIAGRKF